jgi:hypothetical protein
VKPLFRTDQPSVEVMALKGAARGYAILVNHGAQRQKVTVTTTLPIQGLGQITPDGAKALRAQGPIWQMEIDPYDGAVVEWR